MTSILIVEDDITYGMMLKTWLGKKGFQVTSASSIARAQKHIESETVDLILSDLRLPDKDGIDLLKWLGEHGLQIPLIIMTGYADIQSAVQTMKLGACDYIAKPVNPDELLKKIGEALNASSSALKQMMHSSRTDDAFTPNRPSVSPKQTMHSDKMKNQPLKGAEGSLSSSDFLEGESDAAKQLYNYVKLVSPTNMSVLINGASGTGKEYVAHRIHQLSKRADQPFVAIDCGSIPKELAASEFFAHIKGTFTGALTEEELARYGRSRAVQGISAGDAHEFLCQLQADEAFSPVRTAAARAAVWDAFLRQDLDLLPATLPDALRASSSALLTDLTALDYDALERTLEFLANNSAAVAAQALPGQWNAASGTYTVTDASRAAMQTFFNVSPTEAPASSFSEP